MKIAIVRLSALGDIVHSMVVLQFIKKHFPDAKIDWIVQENFAPILRNNPHIDKIISIDLKSKKGWLSLFRKLSKNYDVAIDLQGLIKSAILTPFLSKKRVGAEVGCVKEWPAALFYTHKIVVPCEKNVVERSLIPVSKALGFSYSMEEIFQKESYLFWPRKDYGHIDVLIQDKTILIVPSSSQPNKNYPLHLWKEVVKNLSGSIYILWGNEAEKKRALAIAKDTKAKLLPKMSLDELKYFIAHSDLIIGGDTGPTHMAWALNRPSIVLFGYTTPNLMFQTPRNIPLRAKEVDLCRWNREDNCIQTIPPDAIITAAKKLLEHA